jgi:hypothetical protein
MFRSGAARLGERNGNNNISIDGENDIVAVLRRINRDRHGTISSARCSFPSRRQRRKDALAE